MGIADGIVRMYEMNSQIIKAQTDGITTAESLLQLPFRSNCMNWVLGHIGVYRNYVLMHLGGAPVWDEVSWGIYGTGSPLLTDAAIAYPMEKLLADLATIEQRIGEIVLALPEATLLEAKEYEYVGVQPMYVWLNGLIWHETYHVGQLEMLRQLAGKNDEVFM